MSRRTDFTSIAQTLAALHCRNAGQSNTQIAKSAQKSPQTVRRWLNRAGFKQRGGRLRHVSEAEALVNDLLDPDSNDASMYVKDRLDSWVIHPLQRKVAALPGGVRREGEGYSDQWEFVYNNWLFIVSTYEDGTQIWSAYYKTPIFDWSTEEEKAQGYGWSGGGDPKKLPKGYPPEMYLAKLKRMADLYQNVWRGRYVPEMPAP